MKDKFLKALNNSESKITKSKLRDSITNVYAFEVDGNKFRIEIERLLNWGALNQFGIEQIIVGADVLVYPKDSGSEHYVYADILTLFGLGFEDIAEDINNFVSNKMNETKLSKKDIEFTIKKFNDRTKGFNKTINKPRGITN